MPLRQLHEVEIPGRSPFSLFDRAQCRVRIIRHFRPAVLALFSRKANGQDQAMIATTTDWRARTAIAFAALLAAALVLASMSSASAQSRERPAGLHNLAPSYQDVMSWGAAQQASARVHRRARRAFGSVPNVDVVPRGYFNNSNTNYWYERNRAELRGRW